MKEIAGQVQIAPQADKNYLSSTREEFGCCSRYRACSEKGECLIPELDYSKNCSYRKTLRRELFTIANARLRTAKMFTSVLLTSISAFRRMRRLY